MIIKLSFAELHGPLFLGGRNFGVKLDTKRYLDINLAYERTEKELLVEYNGIQAIVPLANVVSMVPLELTIQMPPRDFVKPGASLKQKPVDFKPIKAQVSTPMGIKE